MVPCDVVSIDHVDAALDGDPMGDDAHRARVPSEEDAAGRAEERSARGVRVDAPDLIVKHAWTHGVMAPGAPAIDAEVKDLAGHAHYDPSRRARGSIAWSSSRAGRRWRPTRPAT